MASQKFGFITIDPVSGSADGVVSVSGDKYTGRIQRTKNFTVTTNGGIQKALVVNQLALAEFVKVDSATASIDKTGGSLTVTGTSNSSKLTFEVTPAAENGLQLTFPATYLAGGAATANGATIASDPGASGEFAWSVTFTNIPENTDIDEITAALKVTADGGQVANMTITQAAGDSYLELDKETITLDVDGTAQTVNVTSNDTWTWAEASARMVNKLLGK